MSRNEAPKRAAISLKYNAGVDKSPRITAKGRGPVAERIIALARKNNIPIKEDPDLVHLLAQVDINQEIPQSLFQVVAELLAFVYRLNRDYSDRGIPSRSTP